MELYIQSQRVTKHQPWQIFKAEAFLVGPNMVFQRHCSDVMKTLISITLSCRLTRVICVTKQSKLLHRTCMKSKTIIARELQQHLRARHSSFRLYDRKPWLKCTFMWEWKWSRHCGLRLSREQSSPILLCCSCHWTHIWKDHMSMDILSHGRVKMMHIHFAFACMCMHTHMLTSASELYLTDHRIKLESYHHEKYGIWPTCPYKHERARH